MAIDHYADLNLHGGELQEASIEKLAADPTGLDLYEGRIWLNITDGKLRQYVGGIVETVVFATELETFGALVGSLDASLATLPATGSGPGGAIRAGDSWVISAAGNVGDIQGLDQLAIGDRLIATADGASAAADFVGSAGVVDLSGSAKANVQGTVSLTAGVAFGLTLGTLTSLQHVTVTDAAGKVVEVEVDLVANTITSNTDLTGLTVNMIGA